MHKIIGADGYIYADAESAELAGTTAVAKIVYVGDDAETSTTYNHGLAMALEDASAEAMWCNQQNNYCLSRKFSSPIFG